MTSILFFLPILIPNELPHKLIPSHLQSTLAACIEASSRPWPFQNSIQSSVTSWVQNPQSPWPADMLVLASRLHEGKGGLTSLQSHGPEKTPAHARLGEGSNLTQNSLHQLPDGAFHYTIYNIGVLESKWFFTSITSWASIISVKSFLNSNSYPLTVYWMEVVKLSSQQHLCNDILMCMPTIKTSLLPVFLFLPQSPPFSSLHNDILITPQF